mgnify:CR=1 FL=1
MTIAPSALRLTDADRATDGDHLAYGPMLALARAGSFLERFASDLTTHDRAQLATVADDTDFIWRVGPSGTSLTTARDDDFCSRMTGDRSAWCAMIDGTLFGGSQVHFWHAAGRYFSRVYPGDRGVLKSLGIRDSYLYARSA